MKFSFLKTGLAILSFSSAAVFADMSADFDRYDTDRDGLFSQNEFDGYMERSNTFERRDLDNDGFLDANEYNELGVDTDFNDWDRNNDSYLDTSEYNDGIYNTFDDNEDGHWDDGEWDDAGDAGVFDI